MNNQELLGEAQRLYEKKKYADVVRTTMQLMEKGDYSQSVMLLSAKALLGLTVTDSSSEQIWQNIFSTINSILDDIDSQEQFQQIRCEILEACEDAERNFCKGQLKKLENNPDIEQYQSNSQQSFVYSLFCIKISSIFSQHPKFKSLKEATEKEGKESIRNAFTDEEKSTLEYEAGIKIFEKAKVNFESKGIYDAYRTARAIVTSQLLWKNATEKLGQESVEVHIQRLEKNKKMMQYMLSLDEKYDVLNYTGTAEWKSDLKKTTEELTKAQKALKKQREKEEKERIAAYWKEHPEEKKKLKKDLAEQEVLHKQLQAEVVDLNAKCIKLQKELEQQLPAEKMYEQQRTTVKKLETELADCWFFQIRKKKELSEQIFGVEQPKMAELKENAQKERAALKESIDTQLANIYKDLRPKEKELEKVKKCISQIETQLMMPR